MNEIFKMKTGLPEDKKSAIPILEQYLLAAFQGNSNGTLIFDDGAIYITTRISGPENYQWTYFTRLKPEGIDLLKKTIIEEFFKTEVEINHGGTSGNQLLWKSALDNVKHEVAIGSGSYDSLPPVFRKIDNLINDFMVKMNEKQTLNN
ncbi:MAG: hypothetical protein AB7S72_08030 [Draconibacterium sp.]